MARKPSQKTKRSVYNLQTDYIGKIESNISTNQSKLSMVLGGLIILVVGILIFNYFNKSKSDLGPAQQIQQEELKQADVSPDQLPGKYTVKEGDTLFLIAEQYYQDGFKFNEIAKANNLTDVNTIEAGQMLNIPKLTNSQAMASVSPQPDASPTPKQSPVAQTIPTELGTGGADTTIWGSKIEGNTYTVVEGDWLSTISARAYGDIFAYQKLAETNNISNPDYIVPGQIIKIPR